MNRLVNLCGLQENQKGSRKKMPGAIPLTGINPVNQNIETFLTEAGAICNFLGSLCLCLKKEIYGLQNFKTEKSL
jgi:hypothetical protein